MQMYAQFLHKAFNAIVSYGVNYKKLRVYAEMGEVADQARKLKPVAGQELLINFFSRLENDLSAAVRRSQLTTIVDNT